MAEGETRGAYFVDSTLPAHGEPTFWFLRPFLRLGFNPWVAALVLTAVAFGGFTLLDWLAVGSPGSYATLYLPFHLVYFSLTAILLGRETGRILDYAESMGATGTEAMRTTLYSTRWALLVALPIEAIYLGPVLLAPDVTVASLFLNADFLGIFHVLVGASAVWAFVYSMKALHALGHAPLRLRPFTEDRSLGLRPFGSAALRLVTIYEVAVLVAAIPMIVGSDNSPTGLPTFAVLGFLGAAFFLLPLRSFRRAMREAKARELAWLGPRYEELVRNVRDSRGSHVDEETVGALSALDKIQRDVQQLPTWPFDQAIVARMASVTVLPLGVAVLARALMILTLHV